MSTPTPLPGRVTLVLLENGYVSPRSPDIEHITSEHSILQDGERRRNGYIVGEENQPEEVHSPSSTVHLNGRPAVYQATSHGKTKSRKVGFRHRISCYTWTWYTMTMATGGIANVLHSIPYRSDWLRIIGTAIFLFNIALFVMNCFFITLRFRWNPGSFKSSFLSQSEALFIPACIVSVGTILINMSQYGLPYTGEWFQTTMQVCFWAYALLAVIASSGMFLILWSTQTFPIHNMTPIWVFPAYPLLLMAPLASNLIDALPNADDASRINSIAIALGAVCIQGTGFWVSLMIYSAFIYRLMTQKLPRETTRPGMFVSVGPSGFTVAGIVHLGNTVIPKIMPYGYEGIPDAAIFLKLMADFYGLWLWGLSLWFFIVSVGAHWQVMRPNSKHHIHFDMTWFSFVFPNTALVTATQAIGKAFDSGAIQVLGTVMAIFLVLTWIFVFVMMFRSFYLRRLLWPAEVDCASEPNIGARMNGVTVGNHVDREQKAADNARPP